MLGFLISGTWLNGFKPTAGRIGASKSNFVVCCIEQGQRRLGPPVLHQIAQYESASEQLKGQGPLEPGLGPMAIGESLGTWQRRRLGSRVAQYQSRGAAPRAAAQPNNSWNKMQFSWTEGEDTVACEQPSAYGSFAGSIAFQEASQKTRLVVLPDFQGMGLGPMPVGPKLSESSGAG
eukprot:s5567_g1.t1